MGATFMKFGRAPTTWRTVFIRAETYALAYQALPPGRHPGQRRAWRVHQQTDRRTPDGPSNRSHPRPLLRRALPREAAGDALRKADGAARVGALPGERGVRSGGGGHG